MHWRLNLLAFWLSVQRKEVCSWFAHGGHNHGLYSQFISSDAGSFVAATAGFASQAQAAPSLRVAAFGSAPRG